MWDRSLTRVVPARVQLGRGSWRHIGRRYSEAEYVKSREASVLFVFDVIAEAALHPLFRNRGHRVADRAPLVDASSVGPFVEDGSWQVLIKWIHGRKAGPLFSRAVVRRAVAGR